MADTQVDTQAGAKLAYSVREATQLTPYGYDRLLAYIKSGELPARISRGVDGKSGKFVILHDDLVEFLKSLPEA